MSNKPFGCDDPRLARYVAATYLPEDEILRDIRERSRAAGLPEIQLGALDARLLEVLTRAAQVRHAVEIGTLGGYSGVALLRGMQPDGRLDTFEIDPRHARVAEESFRRAGFAGRARIHVGPALDRLGALEGFCDLCFIDADKVSYPHYLDWAAHHLRPGGLVIGDNAFLFGELGEETNEPRPELAAMRAFHERLAASGEFRATVIPTGEGLAVGVKV
jgi:caffeoyl-CoA O-methyltransferase